MLAEGVSSWLSAPELEMAGDVDCCVSAVSPGTSVGRFSHGVSHVSHVSHGGAEESRWPARLPLPGGQGAQRTTPTRVRGLRHDQGLSQGPIIQVWHWPSGQITLTGDVIGSRGGTMRYEATMVFHDPAIKLL